MPKNSDYVPGSAGPPDQPPAAEGVGERRPGSSRDADRAPATGREPAPAQPSPAEGDDIGHGTRDPAGTSGAHEVDVPVRPGGGGYVYESDDDTLPHAHERDVQARGDFDAPDNPDARGAVRATRRDPEE